MRHFAGPSFWELYDKLPSNIRELADKNFELLKADPKHPSLHLKKTGNIGRFGWESNIAHSR